MQQGWENGAVWGIGICFAERNDIIIKAQLSQESQFSSLLEASR